MISFSRKHRAFTLAELLVSMGIFAIMALMLFRMFAQIQELYIISLARMNAYEKGSFILELLAQDFRNACPTDKFNSSFYYPTNGTIRNTEDITRIIGFAASARYIPSPNSTSRVCEITYFFDDERGRLYYRLIGDGLRESPRPTNKSKLSQARNVAFDFLVNDENKIKQTSWNPFKEAKDDSFASLRAQIWAPDREDDPEFNTNESPEGRFVLLADGIYNFKVIPYNASQSRYLHRQAGAGGAFFKPRVETNCHLSVYDYFWDPLKNLSNETIGNKSYGVFPIPDMSCIEVEVVPSDVWSDVLRLREAGKSTEAEELAKTSVQVFRRVVCNMCIPTQGENDDKRSNSIPENF